MIELDSKLDFEVSEALSAHEPPEVRGLARDQVRLMVSRVSGDSLTHARFFDFPDFLESGDVVVVNTSATINAALEAELSSEDILLHLSTPLTGNKWVVELRRQSPNGTVPLLDAREGDVVRLPAGASAQLIEAYMSAFPGAPVRLWVAELSLPDHPVAYTARYGMPIRYGYVPKPWPLSFYQTIFADESGSAEMPSAGRAFTQEIVERLGRQGVRILPILLHCGVSSLESHEPPYPERFRVSRETAVAVNAARSRGHRVVAAGTTVVRALESVADSDGRVRPVEGWTDLVITPDRGLRVVDAMLTGFHEPKASHLFMLEALAGREHLQLAYDAAISERYLWHEFGDLHLITR
jgi:S-adenosylmethionine:tRNA ribosyltransferase-isomerase